MKTNREIRAEAWGLLWKEGWIWRFAIASLLLGAVVWGVMGAIALAYRQMGVESLQDFLAAKQQAAAEGLGFTAPSDEAMMRMVIASLFQTFVQYLMSGIGMFGAVSLALKAMRGDRTHWLGTMFAGFGAPFTMFWQMFSLQIRIACWIILAAVPVSVLGVAFGGVVLGTAIVVLLVSVVILWLFYRYRNAWFLKADHPDWGAGKCIGGSVEMMKGWKTKAVRLDCSYWLSVLWLLPPTAALLWLAVKCSQDGLAGLTNADLLLAGAAGVLTVVAGLIIGWYVVLGHAIFYREMQADERNIGE